MLKNLLGFLTFATKKKEKKKKLENLMQKKFIY